MLGVTWRDSAGSWMRRAIQLVDLNQPAKSTAPYEPEGREFENLQARDMAGVVSWRRPLVRRAGSVRAQNRQLALMPIVRGRNVVATDSGGSSVRSAERRGCEFAALLTKSAASMRGQANTARRLRTFVDGFGRDNGE